ncbi:MAG: SpoIID/LytB protein [uncultured bacterium]|nr:MAG: SpoIID/LytB protein [uncultured bacterium]
MQKLIKLIVVLSIFLISYLLIINSALAVDCLNINPDTVSPDDATFCMGELEKVKAQYAPAQEKNKQDLARLQAKINDLNKRIASMATFLKKFEIDILKREKDSAYAQEILGKKAVGQYIDIRLYDPVLSILSASDALEVFRTIKIREKVADADRKTIEKYSGEIIKLKGDKESLEKNKASLAILQKQVSEDAKFLAGEVAKVENYLATLSAKQNAFLAQKLESLGLSRSAYNMKGGCSSDINPFKSPGFSPAFAFFSFGVPNRVGMNQFGAKGRAEAGQDYEEILKAYYNADITRGYITGITIRVSGTNEFGQSFNDSWNIEEYVKHVYEMPTTWTAKDSAALKAQAIAARSYALNYTNNGAKSICPSQSCQVVKKELNNGTWQAAVDATKGIVLTNGGSPITAWFSSTHGGYAYTSADIGWKSTTWTKRLNDTTGNIGGFSDLFNNAYDKSSPTFYCDWGSRSEYNKTAWLKPDEIADIANVILLAKADGSTQKHLSQKDKPNPDGVDTWDVSRVKSELSSRRITPFDSVSSISIGADFGSGRTTSINIDGRTFDGQDFKNYFNLRAPSNIQIVGPLFNIEKR